MRRASADRDNENIEINSANGRRDIGEAATVLASEKSEHSKDPQSAGGLGALPAPEIDGLVEAAEQARVFASLFEASPEEPRLGRYVVRGTLGAGGMGTVLDAVDPGLDRRVAIKVLRRELDERHTTRLHREAQALARLSHPNVVQVYEVGEVDGQTFVAMEMIEGQTLRDWMQQQPPPSWQECVDVYLQVGEGLVAAHEEGLIHRDFKPANAIIDGKGRVRVLDFGLARKVEERGDEEPEDDHASRPWMPGKIDPEPVLDLSLTKTGAVLGTPAYMPPEQMRGREADGRSDQFSYCVSLYEAVYGERPFDGDNIAALMMSTLSGDIRDPPAGMKVPARLRSVLVRGLATEPEQRWSSMDALLVELRSIMAPPRRGSSWRAATLAGLGGALAVSAVVWLGPWTSESVGSRGAPLVASAPSQTAPDDGAKPEPERAAVQEASGDTKSSAGSEPPEGADRRDLVSAESETDSAAEAIDAVPVEQSDEPETDEAIDGDAPMVTKTKPKRKRTRKPKSDRPSTDSAPPKTTTRGLPAVQADARRAARRCGQRLSTLTSKATVRLTVGAGGKVDSVAVLPPVEGSQEAACLEKELSRLKFPSSHQGDTVKWTLKLY